MYFPMINVLYICTDWYEVAGSSASLLDMLYALSGEVHPIVLLNAKGRVYDILMDRGIECIVHPFFYLWECPKRFKTALHHPTKSTLWRFLFLNKQCARYVEHHLRGKKIDVVHSNSSITTVGKDIATRLQVPHIWHIREFLDSDFNVSLYGGRQRLVNSLNSAAARICISKAVYHHWKLLKRNTFVVPNNIYICPLTRKQQKFFLFTAAVISEKKGADVAVQAFRLSGLHKAGYSLLIVGSCSREMQEYLLNLAGESKDFISFEAYSTQMVMYYQQAVALLMCSQCEALGRVTVEAMLAECPVIGRNTGGTMEIIEPNRTGFLFSTIEDCAKYMRSIVSMNTSEIVSNAKMFAMEHFGARQFKYKIYKVYQSLLP